MTEHLPSLRNGAAGNEELMLIIVIESEVRSAGRIRRGEGRRTEVILKTRARESSRFFEFLFG
jgi:hypothetical protein